MAMGWSRRLPYEWRTMLVRASSTARVIDLPCAMGNPRVSVRRSTVPRTTDSHLGLLYRASINNRPPRYPGLLSWSLLATGRGKVFVCDMRGLLGEVVGCFEVAAKDPDRAMKDDEVGDTRGVAVAIAIHMRKSLFLELTNQVFVKGNLEFSGQFDFVRFNHLNLE